MLGDILLVAVLVAAALMLVTLEICTPMFGLLTVMSLGCLVAAVALCFRFSQTVGLAALGVVVVAYPAYVIAAVKFIPRTGLGRRLVLGRDKAAPGDATPEAETLASLVGREGVAETPLRPAGAIRVDGRRIIASSESRMIAKGTAVKVVRVTGGNVIVRPAAEV